MMFMRAILALSLVTFALAIPVAQPQTGDLVGPVGASCSRQYTPFQSLLI